MQACLPYDVNLTTDDLPHRVQQLCAGVRILFPNMAAAALASSLKGCHAQIATHQAERDLPASPPRASLCSSVAPSRLGAPAGKCSSNCEQSGTWGASA